MIFLQIQKNLFTLGLSGKQSIHLFNGKTFIGYLLLSVNVIEHFKFLFRDDVTFDVLTDSLYMTTMAVMCFLCYWSMILKKGKYSELIGKFESIIQLFNKSQSKVFHIFKIEILLCIARCFIVITAMPISILAMLIRHG